MENAYAVVYPSSCLHTLGTQLQADAVVSLFLRLRWPLAHKDGGSRNREQGSDTVDMTQIVLWEMNSVKQLNFLPEYGEYKRFGMVAGELPNLYGTAHSVIKLG